MSDERSSRLVREIFLVSLMSGLPSTNVGWAARRLSAVMEDVRLEPGDVLYREGEIASDHYFLVTGELKVEAPDRPTITFGDRSMIGTFDIMIGRPRARTATATKATHMMRVGAADWIDMLEDNFEMTQGALRGLTAGVHALRLELHDLAEVGTPGALLPPTTRLDLVDRVFALRGVPMFRDADVQSLASLAELAHDVVVSKGDSVFPTGRTNDALVIIVHGRVTARHARRSAAPTYESGALVLGSCALSAVDLEYDARADVETRVLRIAKEDYLDVMEEHFTLARSALKTLALDREHLVDERARRSGGTFQSPSGTVRPAP
jgi:CRP-like cAMP-binding protein